MSDTSRSADAPPISTRHAAEVRGLCDAAECHAARAQAAHAASPITRTSGRSLHAVHALDRRLHVTHERLEVGGGRLALVDDEVGVLFRNRGAADAMTLESRTLDEVGRMAARRVGEYRAAAPGADRLCRMALFEELLDRIRARVRARLEAEGPGDEPLARDRRRHAAVAVAVFGGIPAVPGAAAIDGLDLGHARPGLAAPGPRVHRERAADRAGNAGKEIRGPELPLRALAAEPRAGDAGLRANAVGADALERIQDPVHRDHDAADAAVAHQEVAAEPDPGHGHLRRQLRAGMPRGPRRPAA